MLNNFIKNGYKAEELMENVILVKNFLTEDEASFLLNLAESTDEEGWKIAYLDNLKMFCMQKFGRDDVENLVKEGKFEITDNWSDKIITIYKTQTSQNITSRLKNILSDYSNLSVPGFGTIQRQYDGVPLKPHTDIHTDPSIEYASIIYINDNYNGGEFYFVHKDFQIKPPARSLLIFPGTDPYEHGVKAPEAGPMRYVLPGFIHTKDFYKNNKY